MNVILCMLAGVGSWVQGRSGNKGWLTGAPAVVNDVILSRSREWWVGIVILSRCSREGGSRRMSVFNVMVPAHFCSMFLLYSIFICGMHSCDG